jgi:uncharacterized protein
MRQDPVESIAMPLSRSIRLASTVAVAALILLAVALCHLQRLSVEPGQITLPADGAEHRALHIRVPLGGTLNPDSKNPLLRLLQTNRSTYEGLVRSPVNPGQTQLKLHWRNRTVDIPARFVLDANDSYGDGTPDFLRLHTPEDRQAFRSWFVAIAEAQAERSVIPAEINDCAALLRFAYREALRTHDEQWLSAYPAHAELTSVRQYAFPYTPLGANLFRIRNDAFSAEDLRNGTFAQFADARTLMDLNTYYIGRDIRLARPGDLIFYRQLDQDTPYDVPDATRHHSPFHSMIVATEQSVVYHTGPLEHGKGEMRRLELNDLLHHPDARWRPVSENTNFLGVYRWNILRPGN